MWLRIQRSSEQQFSLIWRNGQQEIFQRGENAWLPHGYDGINITAPPSAPIACGRYFLQRSQALDGLGFSVERFPDALVGQVLLRVRTDDGICLEALRAPLLPSELDLLRPLPRIAQIEQVFPNGSRLCHVRYQYALDCGNPQALASSDQTLPPFIPPAP